MNKLSYREYLEEKKRRKWPKINSGNEGSDDIDEPSDVREEWLIVDKHKNAIISKHGDDQKGATIAARKMDFAEWNKTHKLGRFCPMASHGPGAMAPDVANLEPGGKPKPKKKPASKANKPAAKKPAGKAASAAKKPSPAKAKAKTPGQGGGLGTQIGSLIAKHMAKMFKEETDLQELSPGTLGSYINKAHNRSKFLSMVSNQNHGKASVASSSIDREYQRKKNKIRSDWKYSATNFVNPSKIDAVNHPSKVENPRKAAIVLGNKETKPDPYEHDTQTKKWLIHQSLMRRVAKEKSLQNKETKEKKSHNHP